VPRGQAIRGALAVMGGLNNAIPFAPFVLARGQTTGSLAAILNATTPLFTVIVARVATSDERAGPAKVAGLLLGFAGSWSYCRWPTPAAMSGTSWTALALRCHLDLAASGVAGFGG